MDFFKQLCDRLKEKTTINLLILKENDRLIMSVIPDNDDESICPIILKGTSAELDENFFASLDTSIDAQEAKQSVKEEVTKKEIKPKQPEKKVIKAQDLFEATEPIPIKTTPTTDSEPNPMNVERTEERKTVKEQVEELAALRDTKIPILPDYPKKDKDLPTVQPIDMSEEAPIVTKQKPTEEDW